MILICLVFLLWQSYQKRVKTKLLVIFYLGFSHKKSPDFFQDPDFLFYIDNSFSL